MKIVIALVSIFLEIFFVENVILSEEYLIDSDMETGKDYHLTDPPVEEAQKRDKTFHDVIRLITSGENENESEEPNEEASDKNLAAIKEPCSIVVISNIQTPSKQSLLRKYRYDAKGALIPSSVKYFIKLPEATGSAPVLVPLNEKSFSHLGGFVRIYKEVPPIPQEMT